MEEPPIIELDWEQQYRVISPESPIINFFENLVEPELREILYEIESLTNDRLRDESGDISLVSSSDRIVVPGLNPIMGAFTHISKNCPSRFSNGSYGIYYATRTLETAIEETKFKRTKFLSFTNEEPGEIGMHVYIGGVAKPMHDIQGNQYKYLHDSYDWQLSQKFGQSLKEADSWGIVYSSVRDLGGQCIAALRPPSITIPRSDIHLSYVWDGIGISNVYEKNLIQ